jgi:hypothetical protein
LGQEHHGPNAAGKAGDYWLRNFLDETPEFQNAKDEHEDRGRHANLGSAADTLTVNSPGNEGHGCTRRSPDKDGISA